MAPISTSPRSAGELFDGLPPAPRVSAAEVARAAAEAPKLVVLDDDPTGSQTVAGVPLITAWADGDLRWALDQDGDGFYVLTNTRSMEPGPAARRNREVVVALHRAAAEDGRGFALVSRSDSTLRGHFPLETDVLGEALAETGREVDGVVVVPAYLDAGRVTVASVHWVRGSDGYLPAGETEFADDAVFGYDASDLRAWVEEKTAGRWPAADMATVTLAALREGGVPAVAEILRGLRGGRPVVVDAQSDEDLRVLALAAIEVERSGVDLIYRTGPSFVRNRLGQAPTPPLGTEQLRRLFDGDGDGPRAAGGLVVAGSYVGLTTRQLDALREETGIKEVTLEVPELLAAADPDEVVGRLAEDLLAALAVGDVLFVTSRELIVAADGGGLEVGARVSAALVATVRRVVERVAPRWIVAKGGITSSDIATEALGIRRAWIRGTLLPGIVSLWEPVVTSGISIPYVVFAGNVGDEGSLAEVVGRLREAV